MCITARCAVTDLLQNRLRPLRVSGLIFDDAHNISDDSVEAFVSKLYRDGNAKGWIKAFTDSPYEVVTGYSKTEKVMTVRMSSVTFLRTPDTP